MPDLSSVRSNGPLFPLGKPGAISSRRVYILFVFILSLSYLLYLYRLYLLIYSFLSFFLSFRFCIFARRGSRLVVCPNTSPATYTRRERFSAREEEDEKRDARILGLMLLYVLRVFPFSFFSFPLVVIGCVVREITTLWNFATEVSYTTVCSKRIGNSSILSLSIWISWLVISGFLLCWVRTFSTFSFDGGYLFFFFFFVFLGRGNWYFSVFRFFFAFSFFFVFFSLFFFGLNVVSKMNRRLRSLWKECTMRDIVLAGKKTTFVKHTCSDVRDVMIITMVIRYYFNKAYVDRSTILNCFYIKNVINRGTGRENRREMSRLCNFCRPILIQK